MIIEEMFALYTPWCYLQQPAHPTAGLNASLRALLAAIDLGWEIVQPVLRSTRDGNETNAYHFTLLHTALGQTCQLSVAATSEVDQLLGTAITKTETLPT